MCERRSLRCHPRHDGRKPPTRLMRTRLDTPGQNPTWRIRRDIGSLRLLHLARLVLDAKDTAQQFAVGLDGILKHVRLLGLSFAPIDLTVLPAQGFASTIALSSASCSEPSAPTSRASARCASAPCMASTVIGDGGPADAAPTLRPGGCIRGPRACEQLPHLLVSSIAPRYTTRRDHAVRWMTSGIAAELQWQVTSRFLP
jgi:hypothetical protein